MNWHSHFVRVARKGSATKSVIAMAGMFLLLVVMSSLPAAAGIVNMKFLGRPQATKYAGVYTYPYDLKVNGGPTQWMMCIGYNEHISAGETWKANVFSVGSLDPNTYLVDYEAAFLFKMAVADHGTHPEINAAAWWLLEGAPTSLSASAQSLRDAGSSAKPIPRASTPTCCFTRPFRDRKAERSVRLKTFWVLLLSPARSRYSAPASSASGAC